MSDLTLGERAFFKHRDEQRSAVVAERAACAEIVRAAGCSCRTAIERWTSGEDRAQALARLDSGDHGFDPRCPLSLAAQIEARGAKEP